MRILAERIVEKYHNLPADLRTEVEGEMEKCSLNKSSLPAALRAELEGEMKPQFISIPQPVIEPEFITEEEAAKLIGYSRKYLQKWRKREGGPPFVRKGRTIRYNRTQLLEWMSADAENAE